MIFITLDLCFHRDLWEEKAKMEYLVLTDYRSVYVKFNYLCLNPDKRNLLLSNNKCSVFNIRELKQHDNDKLNKTTALHGCSWFWLHFSDVHFTTMT